MKKNFRIWIYSLVVIVVFMMLTTNCKKGDDNNPAQSGITAKDIDSNVYHVVIIGTQVWMIENLRTTKYNDGTNVIFNYNSHKANTTIIKLMQYSFAICEILVNHL
jgi:hypothetical protein